MEGVDKLVVDEKGIDKKGVDEPGTHTGVAYLPVPALWISTIPTDKKLSQLK